MRTLELQTPSTDKCTIASIDGKPLLDGFPVPDLNKVIVAILTNTSLSCREQREAMRSLFRWACTWGLDPNELRDRISSSERYSPYASYLEECSQAETLPDATVTLDQTGSHK